MRATCAARRQFSRAAEAGKNIDLLIAAADAQAASAALARAVRCLLPRNKMLPALGGKSPDKQIDKVVLPAPLGPMTACNSPTATSRDTSSTAASPPKFLLQSAHLENRVGHRSSIATPFASVGK